jgi:hypothetical protein
MFKKSASILFLSIAIQGFAVAQENNVDEDIPEIKKPPGLCYSERTKSVEDFFKIKSDFLCDNKIDANPDIESSLFYYESPEANDCDLGMSFPGMPDFGFGLDGLDACALVKMVTGPMVDAANSKMKEGMDAALNYSKDKTGLDSFDISLDTNDVITGKDDFGGLKKD